MDTNFLCEQYLNLVYQKNPVQAIKRHVKNTISETYGEILYSSISKLLALIPIKASDSFIDFGSGMGKAALHVFLTTDIKEVYGIEIITDLHERASEALAKIQQDLPEFFAGNRQLNFIKGSFLEILFPTVTIALVNSTCFTQALLNDLGNIIDTTPTIHTVFSLRPINSLKRLVFKKAIRIECSWDSALCYLYKAS